MHVLPQPDKQTNRHTNKQINRQSNKHTHTQTNRHTIQQTNKQTDKHTEKQDNISIKEALKFLHKLPWTDDQRKVQEERITRTVYITGEDKDDLVRFFRHKPRQLSKELTDQANDQIDKVYLNKKGHLCVITQNASQKNKLMKLNRLNNKSVTTSLPFALNKSKSKTKTTSTIRMLITR